MGGIFRARGAGIEANQQEEYENGGRRKKRHNNGEAHKAKMSNGGRYIQPDNVENRERHGKWQKIDHCYIYIM